MILVGFTRDLTLAAPRRPDKPASPWVSTAMVRAHEMHWLPPAAVDELRQAHGDAVCDMTPSSVSRIWGWTTPQRVTLLRVVDCPACDAGRAQRMTRCPLCEGATRVYNL